MTHSLSLNPFTHSLTKKFIRTILQKSKRAIPFLSHSTRLVKKKGSHFFGSLLKLKIKLHYQSLVTRVIDMFSKANTKQISEKKLANLIDSFLKDRGISISKSIRTYLEKVCRTYGIRGIIITNNSLLGQLFQCELSRTKEITKELSDLKIIDKEIILLHDGHRWRTCLRITLKLLELLPNKSIQANKETKYE